MTRMKILVSASSISIAAALAMNSSPVIAGPAAMTHFDPSTDGFHFSNGFTNDLVPKGLNIPGMNIHTGGLCGGMVYAALDYYDAHKPIPIVSYQPATGTRLAHFIYQREVDSITPNLPEWTNMFVNFEGKRNAELFRRGLDGSPGGPLARLKSYIDRGEPVVIDLKGTGKGSHQVLAIGYDFGRYNGHFGPNEADLKIKVYDPNEPDVISNLEPEPAVQKWVLRPADSAGSSGDEFRGYFVDTKYVPKTPPTTTYRTYPDDNKIHELVLTTYTGPNDLRGGQANLDLEIDLAHGNPEVHKNINLGARWLPNYNQNARVILNRAVAKDDIRKLVLTYTAKSGVGHDTFRMKSLQVQALENNALETIGDAPAKYFTIRDARLEVPITSPEASAGQIRGLKLTFHTGDDALRGNQANLNVNVVYADGTTQVEPNVNHGEKWVANSANTVEFELNRAVDPNQIRQIVLQTTAKPGFNSDKWNMSSVQIMGASHNDWHTIATHGADRFTPTDNTLAIPVGS